METSINDPATAPMDGFKVVVPSHPLIRHWVSVLRDLTTPSHAFSDCFLSSNLVAGLVLCFFFCEFLPDGENTLWAESAMGELGRLLIYEATRDWLPTVRRKIQSPMGTAVVESINPMEPIMIVPILRAGLALAEFASSILPSTKTLHLGLARDEITLQPCVYLNKLPDKFPKGCHILLVDPMLATGGTVAAAVDLMMDRGAEICQIKIISAVAAPPALKKLNKKFPGICVYTGAMDQIVNEKGFIVPGLGDAGDRSYGT